MDSQFGAADYNNVADRFWATRTWGTGFSIHEEMSFELEQGDTSLPLTARGYGNTGAFIDNVAALTIRENIAQGSELLLPVSD